MSHKIYQHACGHGRRSCAVCPECGEPGVYDGWGYSMIDMMCRYQHRYGLKPTGAHRPYADALLQSAFCPCLRCSGRGNLISPDECNQTCPSCHGDGSRPTMPFQAFAALRDRVLERYPDARGGNEWPEPAR